MIELIVLITLEMLSSQLENQEHKRYTYLA